MKSKNANTRMVQLVTMLCNECSAQYDKTAVFWGSMSPRREGAGGSTREPQISSPVTKKGD